MLFQTRKLIKPEDLNPRQTLFGGRLLQWIDEELSIFTMSLLGTKNIVTKIMSEMDFVSSATSGEIVEIGAEVVKYGTTSITLRCSVRNMETKKTLVTIEKVVFVSVDDDGKPCPHGKS
jgi:acyl-CoA thioesterase YciA